MNDIIEKFREAMRRAGLEFAGEILADGKLHRFKASDDREKNSWYVLHSGSIFAGAFGCWKRDIKETWHDNDRQLSQAEWQRIRGQWQEADQTRKKVERERREAARKTAAWILARAKPITAHSYLTAKNVQHFGELREYKGALVLPLRGINGELHNLQFIHSDGTKRFLTGGQVADCFFTLADKADGPLLISEGYATGASIHAATGLATICAMNCGNLLAVAMTARELWPQREIIIAGDNDQWTDGNPGLAKATVAAKKVHAKLAMAQFKSPVPHQTDFNDLATTEGMEAVKLQIGNAAEPVETDEDSYARLAALAPAEYDRCRDAEAEALGIRVSTLDAEVQRLRGWTGGNDSTLQGCAINLPDVEPWPQPVNGKEVLDEAADTFSRYLALPPCAADAMALWSAHCHCFEAFEITPRLNVTSPEKGCGKTTARDVLSVLVPRPLSTENMTTAVLFRLIEARKPTVLADEYDAWLRHDQELRGMLNAGHRRGGQALRCEGDNHEVRAFRVFSPAVLCGIGALPGTLHDRSIVICLERAKPGELRERFSQRRTQRETELCRKLTRFAADNMATLEKFDPKMPDGAFNRIGDNWRPLFAIAEIAGGDWPQRATVAFSKLTNSDADVQGIGTALLADIADLFATTKAEKLPSAEIVEALAKIEGREWAEWGKARKPISTNQLAKQLRRFTILPRTIKLPDGNTAKGYHREMFDEAFARYLPQSSFPKRNPVTMPENTNDSVISETSPAKAGLRIENNEIANNDAESDGVTVQKAGPVENDVLLI